MTEIEIEQEIQARIDFKMNEFLTAVRNRVGFKYQQAFDMTIESQYAWKAFEEVAGMIKKETIMATPYDDMAKRKKHSAKEKAVSRIVEKLKLRGRDYDANIKTIVAVIEEVQDWNELTLTCHPK